MNDKDWRFFDVARDEVTQESHLLWSRFASLSAIQAGFLVVAAERPKDALVTSLLLQRYES